MNTEVTLTAPESGANQTVFIKKTAIVSLWDKNKAPVCPSLARARRVSVLPVTSYGYAWSPNWEFSPS